MISTGANCKGQGYPLCEKNVKCPVQDACAERESSWNNFVRERFNIWKFETEKRMRVQDIEHGLNLDPGQV